MNEKFTLVYFWLRLLVVYFTFYFFFFLFLSLSTSFSNVCACVYCRVYMRISWLVTWCWCIVVKWMMCMCVKAEIILRKWWNDMRRRSPWNATKEEKKKMRIWKTWENKFQRLTSTESDIVLVTERSLPSHRLLHFRYGHRSGTNMKYRILRIISSLIFDMASCYLIFFLLLLLFLRLSVSVEATQTKLTWSRHIYFSALIKTDAEFCMWAKVNARQSKKKPSFSNTSQEIK